MVARAALESSDTPDCSMRTAGAASKMQARTAVRASVEGSTLWPDEAAVPAEPSPWAPVELWPSDRSTSTLSSRVPERRSPPSSSRSKLSTTGPVAWKDVTVLITWVGAKGGREYQQEKGTKKVGGTER